MEGVGCAHYLVTITNHFIQHILGKKKTNKDNMLQYISSLVFNTTIYMYVINHFEQQAIQLS